MRFFEVKGRKIRMGIIDGQLCAQAREAGRLGRAIPLFPVPEGTNVEECVEQINAFDGEEADGGLAIYSGDFFGRRAVISFSVTESFPLAVIA